MAWIKRNLFFVISMAVGLALTGYCAWLFYQDFGKNSEVAKDEADVTSQYDALVNNPKIPYPSEENIQHAREDQAQVKQLVDELRTSFTPFPTPSNLDAKGFSEYLENSIFDLKTRATNAGVTLPDNFAFAFTDQRNKLNYPTECIPLWMQQMAEIKVICDILYRAKVNTLLALRRVPMSPSNDMIVTSEDLMDARIVPTPFGTATPYKIELKCFSKELAAVLDGLARSSNCFVVKNIVERPFGPRTLDQPGAEAEDEGLPVPVLPGDPPVQQVGSRNGRQSPEQYKAAMEAYQRRVLNYQRELDNLAAAKAAIAGVTGTVTVEREQLLYITLSVDVDKFK
jgi:hypothetical protein